MKLNFQSVSDMVIPLHCRTLTLHPAFPHCPRGWLGVVNTHTIDHRESDEGAEMSAINGSCIVLSQTHVLTAGALVLPFLMVDKASQAAASTDDIEIDIDMDLGENSAFSPCAAWMKGLRDGVSELLSSRLKVFEFGKTFVLLILV